MVFPAMQRPNSYKFYRILHGVSSPTQISYTQKKLLKGLLSGSCTLQASDFKFQHHPLQPTWKLLKATSMSTISAFVSFPFDFLLFNRDIYFSRSFPSKLRSGSPTLPTFFLSSDFLSLSRSFSIFSCRLRSDYWDYPRNVRVAVLGGNGRRRGTASAHRLAREVHTARITSYLINPVTWVGCNPIRTV